MSQYIHDNTEDEFTHQNFLNAYLVSKGADPVNLDQFRTLSGSTATGAQPVKRLTNLMQLTVDTSWWLRYRSPNQNPDFGDTFQPIIPGLAKGQFPAIPRSDADLKPLAHIQAIANTAAFHFGTIEQGGSSLYPSLAQRVTNVEVLRILLSIGPTETSHFQTWHDKAGNAPPVTDPTNGLVFPDLSKFAGDELRQANLIMPEPTCGRPRHPGRRRAIASPRLGEDHRGALQRSDWRLAGNGELPARHEPRLQPRPRTCLDLRNTTTYAVLIVSNGRSWARRRRSPTRDRHYEFDCGAKGPKVRLHLRVDRGHGGIESVDLIEMKAQQEAMVLCHVAAKGLAEFARISAARYMLDWLRVFA
jgi:hypothetical protein